MAEMNTVPVRIVAPGATKADIITLQLIEKLNREYLDPIDEAAACILESQEVKKPSGGTGRD